jgi:hypothetical protein
MGRMVRIQGAVDQRQFLLRRNQGIVY